MSWNEGADFLADLDKMSLMTANTPASYIIGIPTPPPRSKVAESGSQPTAVFTAAPQIKGAAKSGAGRGAIIESLMVDCNSQHRVDLERQEHLRKVNPYDYSNHLIEKNFREGSESAASPPKLVRDIPNTASDKATQ